MGRHVTLVAVPVGDGRIALHGLDNSDRSADILARFHIHKQGAWSLIEALIPDLSDPTTWGIHFNCGRPQWWSEEMDLQVKERFAADHSRRWNASSRTYRYDGDLYLGHLSCIPEGITIIARGYLNLAGVRKLTYGTRLVCATNLYLGSRSLPEGTRLTAGCDIYLEGLADVPPGMIACGGRVHLANGISMKGEDVG